MSTQMAALGEWLPDAPAIGALSREGTFPLASAESVWRIGGRYEPMGAPSAQGTALSVTPVAAFTAQYDGDTYTIAGSASTLYYSTDDGTTWTSCGTSYTGSAWSFAQYGNCVYATNGVDAIQTMDLSDTSPAFADLATAAPKANVLGVIRDFLVAGDVTDGDQTGAWVMQWSALANAASWPTPNTQDARAAQAGAQSLYADYGAIQHIANGEELALVFQQSGISRVQYVGGDVVFSFYTFERKHGLVAPDAIAQVGNVSYFLSSDGFYATDGSSVVPIGRGKVDAFFAGECSDTSKVRAAVDTEHDAIVFAYPTSSGHAQLMYSLGEKMWTHATGATSLLYQGRDDDAYEARTFDSSKKVATFTGASTPYVDSKDMLLTPSRHTLVTGVRPWSDATTTIQIASRNTEADTVTFGDAVTPETGSGMASVRADGYLHRVRANLGSDASYLQALDVEYAARGVR